MVRRTRTLRSARPSRSRKIGGGPAGPSGPEPTLVGFTILDSDGVTITGVQCLLAPGSAAGDFCVVGHATNYGLGTPAITNGVVANHHKSGNPSTIIYAKLLEAGDITNGYVLINLPAARGAMITAVFTGGTGTETPEAIGQYTSGTFPYDAIMPIPTSSNTLLILMTGNTNSAGRQTTVAAPTNLSLVGNNYFGTSNDAWVTMYWAWNQTGASFDTESLTATVGPDVAAAAEFTFA